MEALRALATVGPRACFSHTSATDAVRDEVGLAVLVDQSDHFGLCEPNEGIGDFEGAA